MKRIVRKKPVDADEQREIELINAVLTIRAIREELGATNNPTAPLADQLFHWHRVRQFYDTIKALANEAEQLSRYMSYEQLPEAFRKNRGTRSMILHGIGRFSLGSRTTAKVLEQYRANTFLCDNGKEDVLRVMAPSSTMNAVVAELIKAGVEPDEERDGIKATTVSYTSFNKD